VRQRGWLFVLASAAKLGRCSKLGSGRITLAIDFIQCNDQDFVFQRTKQGIRWDTHHAVRYFSNPFVVSSSSAGSASRSEVAVARQPHPDASSCDLPV
jgi:hypothetical protein